MYLPLARMVTAAFLTAAAVVPVAAQVGPGTGQIDDSGTILSDEGSETIQARSYTLDKDPSGIDLPAAASRVAILIGNGAYDPETASRLGQAGSPPEAPGKTRLTNLKAPCADVKAVAGQLASIGWHRDEVHVLCDLRNEQVYTAISKLTTATVDDRPRLVVLYLAGHGMMVDGRNYFFGTDTRIDMRAKAAAALKAMAANKASLLFANDEGVDLYYALSRLLDARELPFAFLVVLDACRNNPLLRYMGQAVDEASISTAAPVMAENYRTLLKGRVLSPRPSNKVPGGLQIVYATVPNNTILDEGTTGGSRVASQLASTMAAGLEIRAQLRDIEKRMGDENQTLPLRDRQEIDWDGGLYNGSEWCFFGCARPGSAGLAPTRAGRPVQLASVDARSAPPLPGTAKKVSDVPAAEAPRLPPTRIVATFPSSVSRPVLLDVLWCSGGVGAESRRARAVRLADAVAGRLYAGNDPAGRSQLQAVRLRELTAEENAVPRNQRNIDALYVDPAATEPGENALAVRYVRPFAHGVKVRGTDRPTKDYIEVSFCAGAYTGPRAPRVYVQVATDADRPIASRAMTVLDAVSPDLSIDPTPETMSRNPTFPLSKYPASTQVRVSDRRLLPRANQLATDLSVTLGMPVKVLCTKLCSSQQPGRNLELWIGTDPAGAQAIDAAVAPFSTSLSAGQGRSLN